MFPYGYLAVISAAKNPLLIAIRRNYQTKSSTHLTSSAYLCLSSVDPKNMPEEIDLFHGLVVARQSGALLKVKD